MTSPLRLAQALSLALLLAATASAQLLDHVAAGVGSHSIVGNDVAIAADGSHYMSGTFRGTATFGSISITAWAGTQWDDAFLVKHDANGVSQWARRGGTNLWNDMGNAVAVGPDGSVYWVGAFTAEGVFDGGDNPDLSITNVADWDVFIAKYDPDGNIQWLRGLRGAGQNIGQGVTVDSQGNVYFVGLLRQTATIGDVTLQSAGSSDGFIVKLDPAGEPLWGMTVGGIDGVAAYEVEAHPAGGIVVSGQFRGVALFGDIPMQSAGLNDTYAARIDADGDVLWATQIGAGGDEFNRGVAVAPDGGVYLTGSFEQQILVGTDILTSAGFSDVYVVRLDPDGTPQWGRRGGGGGFDFGEAVAVDLAGNVYATGYVDATGTFSTGNGDQSYTTAGDNDAYLAVFSPQGDLLELELVGNTNRDRGSGVAVHHPSGRIALSGFFRSSLTVGNTTVQGVASNDAFIAFGNTVEGPPPVGPVVFVDADASPEGDGQSWESAFNDLQDALALAREYPAIVNQVWVATGTYLPSDESDFRASFDLVDGVALYGGFAGDETDLDQRDPETNVTTLSGLLIDDGQDSVRSIHVITADEVTAILDGFVVTEGCACGTPEDPSGNDDEDLRGGGIHVLDSQITLANMKLHDNRAGLGWEGTSFAGGGAVFMSGGSLVIAKSSFTDNQAYFVDSGGGGALYLENVTIELSESIFSNNETSGEEAGEGGAVLLIDSEAYIFDSSFSNNRGFTGGALFSNSSDVVAIKTLFQVNDGPLGAAGAVAIDSNSHFEVINCRFINNRAEVRSGALEVTGSAYIVNSIFVGNHITEQHGSAAGAIRNSGELTIVNSTISDNARMWASSDIINAGTLTIYNSILWTPADQTIPIDNASGTVSVNRAIIRNGFEGGIDVLDEDPLFILNPWKDSNGLGDLRLQEASPAIDFGLTEFLPPDTYDLDGDGDTTEPIPIDLAGEPRIQGNEVDLGAYESPFTVSGEVGPGEGTLHLAVYPNPARDAATIDFSLPKDHAEVRVEVFDVLGRRVALLHDGPAASGATSLELDARGLPAGLYFVRITAEGIHLPAATVTVVR